MDYMPSVNNGAVKMGNKSAPRAGAAEVIGMPSGYNAGAVAKGVAMCGGKMPSYSSGAGEGRKNK